MFCIKHSGKHGSKAYFLLQVIKENAELSADYCGCEEFVTLQCNKLIYGLLCAETSTNQLPDVISYAADHHSVFPEISSINRL